MKNQEPAFRRRLIRQFETIAELEKALKALENHDALVQTLVQTIKALVEAYQFRALVDQLPVVQVADQFIKNLEK